jgi:hypothetical protein
LKKLLCFGERVWEELRGVVAKGGWGRAVRRPTCPRLDQDEGTAEERESVEADCRCLEISQGRMPWWEVQHWDEIYEERRSWSDLSPEDQRTLRKLLGRW